MANREDTTVKKKILVVEDHADTLEVLGYQLHFLGYEFTVARNGVEAVERTETEIPDLVIMDIMLPKLNGFDATLKIRANPKTCLIPILATTAKAGPEYRDRCLKAGCDGYLAKPFTHVELGRAIVDIFRRRAAPSVSGGVS
ncbi:MAG TPA: response regulator [Candidatus Eisenbacteria bacterium]|nr:response regulator [Candidatus Eisenbacteria bacterium]